MQHLPWALSLAEGAHAFGSKGWTEGNIYFFFLAILLALTQMVSPGHLQVVRSAPIYTPSPSLHMPCV